MNWKLKATIQNAVSLLPSEVSYKSYYLIQRYLGKLKNPRPVTRLQAGVDTWDRILAAGSDPVNKCFFEVGTGRIPLVPLSYWLMGAEKTTTVDLNRYVIWQLVKENVDYIINNQTEITSIFKERLIQSRFDKLVKFGSSKDTKLSDFLDMCHVEYSAPSDARDTKLPDHSIDYHTSFTVLEHIPEDTLKQIIQEGSRIVKRDGLFVHRIDYSDHFSHSDNKITKINFLQFNDEEWDKFAGNRYMYMNRLRHDDYLNLFQNTNHEVIFEQPDTDNRSADLLKSGQLKLSERFSDKTDEILSINSAWIASRPI